MIGKVSTQVVRNFLDEIKCVIEGNRDRNRYRYIFRMEGEYLRDIVYKICEQDKVSCLLREM